MNLRDKDKNKSKIRKIWIKWNIWKEKESKNIVNWNRKWSLKRSKKIKIGVWTYTF